MNNPNTVIDQPAKNHVFLLIQLPRLKSYSRRPRTKALLPHSFIHSFFLSPKEPPEYLILRVQKVGTLLILIRNILNLSPILAIPTSSPSGYPAGCKSRQSFDELVAGHGGRATFAILGKDQRLHSVDLIVFHGTERFPVEVKSRDFCVRSLDASILQPILAAFVTKEHALKRELVSLGVSAMLKTSIVMREPQ